MSRPLRWIRPILLWLGPALVLLLAVASGFVVWCVGTEPGTRWVLQTAVHQFNGQVGAINGSIWRGLHVKSLDLNVPVVSLQLDDLYLRVDWGELRERRLLARNLSIGRLNIDVLHTPDEAPTPSEPFSVPVLPVSLVLDKIALGELNMKINGEPILLDVRNLQASLAVSSRNAQLVFQRLQLGHDDIEADIEGDLQILKLADPWPLAVHLKTQARTKQPDSLLCVRHFLPTLPPLSQRPAGTTTVAKSSKGVANPLTDLSGLSSACALDVDTAITGSLTELTLAVTGSGQDVDFDVNAHLVPLADFPLRDADLALRLGDGSSLNGKLKWDALASDVVSRDRVTGSLQADKLNIGMLAGSVIPDSVISAGLTFDAQLLNRKDVLSADVDLNIGSGSIWNKQPLSGVLKAKLVNTLAAQQQAAVSTEPPALWTGLQLAGLTADMRLGKNSLKGDGSLGAINSRLNLDVAFARLADLWPGLAGGVQVTAQLGGSIAKHAADLKLVYSPDERQANQLGKAPFDLHAALNGGWSGASAAQGAVQSWRGVLTQLQINHAGVSVRSDTAVPITLVPDAVAPAWPVQVGAASIQFLLPSRQGFVISHKMTQVGAGRWATQGAIDKLTTSRRILKEVQDLVGMADSEGRDRGGVIVSGAQRNDRVEIVYGVNWDLKFAGALSGQAHIKRLSGDLIIPGDPDFPLGLQDLSVDLTAKPVNASASRLSADIKVATAKMGHVSATANALLHSSSGGGFALKDSDPKTVEVDADIEDLGWLSLFVGDATDVGGSVKASLKARSRPDGTWATSGAVTGQQIRFVRVDDGVRLLDGVLAAHFEENRFVLDSLRFPARLRVSPKEWRTQEWVSTNPDAKDGYLTLGGSWDLVNSVGAVNIDLYRYPLMQRSDRYAMVTGKLKVTTPFPKLTVAGELTADAGWVDLDVLSSVPTLDSDVVVVRRGQTAKASAPVDVSLDLTVDLGPRFYITGYGVDSGLVGKLHIRMLDNKLTASGGLRTRGGAIDVYGQHLQLRRGSITFQGDITNPTLNIEALRTGVAVEAGVRVAGTAKRPRIDLVSYPDVSDVQKLSWLLLGRGPDDSGGDAALLFSVGTSFLSGDEPFYRKFGLDEVSMKSGELGSTGSILPVESVVRGLDSGTSDIERKFVVASKKLNNGITLSIEQALSDTGTVGRASYQLARGLSAVFSVGTVTGVALIYRVLSKD